MAAQEVAKDKIICTEGQSLDAIHIIVSGSVKAHFSGGDFILKKGDVVGLCDLAYDSHFFTYSTLENSSFVSFPIKDKTSIGNIVKLNPEVAKMMYTSMINQVALILSAYMRSSEKCSSLYERIRGMYEAYSDICAHNNIISRTLPALEDFSKVEPEGTVPDWIIGYYSCMREFPQELRLSLSARIPFLTGMLIKASSDIHSTFSAMETMQDYISDNSKILLQESGLDIFDLYSTLFLRLKQGTPDSETLKSSLDELIDYLETCNDISHELLKTRVSEFRSKLSGILSNKISSEGKAVVSNNELTNALDIILEYAGVDEETANGFKICISKYKKLSDKASSDDVARKLRQEITAYFYAIYTEAFKVSVKDVALSRVLKMFFNFGFVDAELAGIENANYLYNIADDFRGDSDNGVYTAYEWLTAIYNKEKEPSRNEFDTDYLQYLHEQKVQGKIDDAGEKTLAKDPGERVLFELTNMFPTVNKMTYGRLSSFCPVLCEADVIKPLDTCMVTVDGILESYRKLEAIDYGAFYRETIYTNDACGISKEVINVRITPDIILMPNIGTRGVMWQEVEGKKRTTPARYIMSVFHLDDLPTTITRLTGEYRWEMCKRVQGGRWNDVSDRSLTSEYFDYVQFYRKNSELSSDAKEKVKTSLMKAKNSFKEMFVRDYIVWVLYEGTGSPRLNKVARAILCTYCPFPKDLRQRIGANPMFKDLLERYEIKLTQKLHHYDNVIQKLKGANQPVPDELMDNRDFLEGKI